MSTKGIFLFRLVFCYYLWLLIDVSLAYKITYTDYNIPGGRPSKVADNAQKPSELTASLDLNQIIIFNVGDFVSLENLTRAYRQKFDQDSINYCNFDPDSLSNKSPLLAASQLRHIQNHHNSRVKPNFNVNIFLKGGIFNQSSQITVRIEFLNQLAESNQLWYLLEAKSACTNQVVGTWQLIKQPITDTIYCYNRDDTVFGHKNNQQDRTYDQVWLPTNTEEDIYFVIALFTDEAYATLNPSYFILNSPIFRYQPSNRAPLSPYLNEHSSYDPCRSQPSNSPQLFASYASSSSSPILSSPSPPLSSAPLVYSTHSSINPTPTRIKQPVVVVNNHKWSSTSIITRRTVSSTTTTRTTATTTKTTTTTTKTTTSRTTTKTTTTTTTTTVTTTTTTRLDFEKIKSNFHKLFTTISQKKIPLTLTTSTQKIRTTATGVALTMNTESEVVVENYKADKSILIDLVLSTSQCLKQEDDLNFINDIKAKLTDIYRSLNNFKRVVIKEIINYNCSSSLTRKRRELIESSQVETSEKSATNELNNKYKLSVQHYVLFRTSIKNQTRVEAMNTLKSSFKSSLSSTSNNNNLTILDTYFVETNGTSINFNNPCSMYNYFRICQNNGVCKMSENLTPSCSCPFIDEYSYYTGDYCDVKVKQPFDLEKFKMIIAISVLGAIALVCLISLLMCLIYKKRQNKEILKKYPSKLLISSSTSSNFSTTSNKNKSSPSSPNGTTDVAALSKTIQHQLARSVLASPSDQHSKMAQQQQAQYEHANYIVIEQSSPSTQQGALVSSSSSSAPFAQSPEYMSVQDLMITNHHLIKSRISPPPLQCYQQQQQNSPPVPLDVALVEDLRFCFSLRNGLASNESTLANQNKAAINSNTKLKNAGGKRNAMAENISPTGSSGSSSETTTSSNGQVVIQHSSSSTASSSELFPVAKNGKKNMEEKRRLIKTSSSTNTSAHPTITTTSSSVPATTTTTATAVAAAANKGLVCLTDGSSTSYKFFASAAAAVSCNPNIIDHQQHHVNQYSTPSNVTSSRQQQLHKPQQSKQYTNNNNSNKKVLKEGTATAVVCTNGATKVLNSSSKKSNYPTYDNGQYSKNEKRTSKSPRPRHSTRKGALEVEIDDDNSELIQTLSYPRDMPTTLSMSSSQPLRSIATTIQSDEKTANGAANHKRTKAVAALKSCSTSTAASTTSNYITHPTMDAAVAGNNTTSIASSVAAANKPVDYERRKMMAGAHQSHVNQAYDMTLVNNNNSNNKKNSSGSSSQHYNQITTIPVPFQQTQTQPVAVNPNPIPPPTTTKVASFSIQSIHNMVRNSLRGRRASKSPNPSQPPQTQSNQGQPPQAQPRQPVKSVAVNAVCALKRESSQLVPQSLEKQMARNFQSIKPFNVSQASATECMNIANNSSLMDTSANGLDNLIQQPQNTTNNNNKNTNNFLLMNAANLNTVTATISNSTSTNNNQHPTSKYTDSTSLPTSNFSSADQSLKDEDAWLPILTIAEEQMQKLESEKLKEAFLTESYVF